MKLKKLLVLATLVLPLTVVAPVFAQNAHSPDQPVSSKPASAAAEKNLAERVSERKQKSTRKLAAHEINMVKFRCQAAVGQVKSAQARIHSFEAKRTQVYGGLVTRLQSLSPKLQAAGVNTGVYDEQVAALKAKSEAYTTDLTALKTAVDDLATMDCAADPEGFAATVLAAHELRASVIAKGQEFRSYLKDTFKPTFTAIRSQITTKKTEE